MDESRAYDAILLDLDGTFVADDGRIRPRALERARRAHEAGVRVMIATGRSEVATRPILEQLGFDTPAVVFNGAAIYCPVAGRLVEERVLSSEVVRRLVAWTRDADLLPVVAGASAKHAPAPRSHHEESALRYFRDLRTVEHHALPDEYIIRFTAFSATHADSGVLAEHLERAVASPVYVTHFPLNALADHRDNPLLVADVQPPCLGKAEGLRVLFERYGIAPERVVAVGDATNDITMFQAAGLSVAVENAMPEARACADRVIGNNNSDALADLFDELFGL